MDARRMNARAVRLRFSKSLDKRRQRLIQAMVRSTTQPCTARQSVTRSTSEAVSGRSRLSREATPQPRAARSCRSNVDALDLVERDLLGQPVVELRGSGRGVPRDPGRHLEVASVAQVLGDPGPAGAVRADLRGKPRPPRPALDHLERALPRHGLLEESVARIGHRGPEQGPATVRGDVRGLQVGIDILLRRVVGGDHVVAPALLVQRKNELGSWA